MRERSFDEHVSAAVTAVWADAIPTIALQALWGRGDVAPVYAIAGLRSPEKRPLALAWLAALDPEPGSTRVEKAVLAALREPRGLTDRASLCALVPLAGHPSVTREIRRLGHRGARTVLELRTADEPRWPIESRTVEPALAGALRAVWLAERGRSDEAAEALTAALAESPMDSTVDLALILALRRLDAWERAADRTWNMSSGTWPAFVAGQVDVAAAERLFGGRRSGQWCAAAALGAGRPAEEWREVLPCSEARSEELYLEGLITGEEQWALRFGDALVRSDSYEEIDALVFAACVAAHEGASGFAERLSGRAGPPRDEQWLAGRREKLQTLIAGIAEDKPSWRPLRHVLRLARRMADGGGAAEVLAAIEMLEQRWGPAERWGEDGYGIIDMAAELLACAQGRALAASQLYARAEYPTIDVRARICAGLARDGHVDELREPLAQLLAGSLEPDEVALLVPAALGVDGSMRGPMERALAETLASLPADAEAARAWLDRQAAAALRTSRPRRRSSRGA
jgi:hypothetical protein